MRSHAAPRRNPLVPLLATIAALPMAASAGPDGARTLDRIVVTATRTPTTVDAALAAVEVIDRRQIDASSARSLPELLRGRAGIAIVNQGGLGKLSTLFLRGTESDHTLFLVDGVRVGSPTSGLTSLQDIPLAQIERIEIVRGPRSSLYGADAIGGVIQVFTRRDGQPGLHGRGRLAIGSNALREASVGVSARGARAGIAVDLAHQDTDGVNACRGDYDPVTWVGAGCFIVPGTHLDRDGYRNGSASVRADLAPADGWRIDLHALRAIGHNDYDGDYVDNSDIVQQVAGGSMHWAATDTLQLKLAVGRNTDDSDNRLGAAFSNRFHTIRDSASLQADAGLAPGHLLTLGLDWLRDGSTVTDPWAPFSARRGNRAVFAQYQGTFGGARSGESVGTQDLQLSLRRDDNDQFGGRTTGSIAWGVDMGRGWRATASHGTAFKAPSFNELYYPGYANPLLRPEAARSSELSLARSREDWHVQASAYQTRIADLIAWDAALGTPGNVEQADIRGLELTGGLELGGWSVRGQLGWLDARNRSAGPMHGKPLARRPHRSARLDLDRDIGAWGVGLSAVAESARWDDVANTQRVGGYGTVDARLSWAFSPGWTVQANLINVLDKRYETSAWYSQPGRSWVLGLRWQPQPR